MNEKSLIRVTMEVQDVHPYNQCNRDDKFVYETSYTDTDLETILQGLYGGFVSMTFDPESVLKGMINFAVERLGGVYIPEEDCAEPEVTDEDN